jgi:hypothetical protein
VAAAICNTDYEGEIKDVGDVVQIRTIADIVIRDYNKGQSLQIQRPDSPKVEFPIRKAKYFNFICDDIDKHQADVKLMDNWSSDAAQQMKITVDTEFLADIYASADTYNKGQTAGKISGDINLGYTANPLEISKANILDFIVDVGICLDEQNVPEDGRSMVIPSWFAGMLKKSDLKDASLTGDGKSVLRNGRIGSIDKFTLYVSNLLYKETVYNGYHAIALQRNAVTWAAQMTKMESLRAESTFGTLVRGLNVYDYKALKDECLCDLYIKKSAA